MEPCQPRASMPLPATLPSTPMTWTPATTAVIRSVPERPSRSAIASAAGTTADEVCQADMCASSYSALCPSVPLTQAACGALSLLALPAAVASAGPPRAAATARTGCTLGRAAPRSCRPSWSSTRRLAIAVTSAGRAP